MYKIHGLPGIGSTGENGNKGKSGISNIFYNKWDGDINNIPNTPNNTFIYDNKLFKYYKNNLGEIEFFSNYAANVNTFIKKDDFIFTTYKTIISNNNKTNTNTNTLLTISSNKENLLSLSYNECKCIFSFNLKENKFVITSNPTQNKVFIDKIYTRDNYKDILLKIKNDDNFIKVINHKNHMSFSESHIYAHIDLYYAFNINEYENIMKNIRISIIVNGSYYGDYILNKTFSKEFVIKNINSEILNNHNMFILSLGRSSVDDTVLKYNLDVYCKISCINPITNKKNQIIKHLYNFN